MQYEFDQTARPAEVHVGADDYRTDSTAGNGMSRVQELTEQALRSALQSLMRGGSATDRATRSALAAACTAARESEIHVEKLVVLIKTRWRQLPEAQLIARLSRDTASDALDHMITACIEQYFGTSMRRPQRTD